VAVYRGGVFGTDETAFSAAVGRLLLDRFRPHHCSTVEQYLTGLLYDLQRLLPVHLDRPLVNLLNGMLDLETLELLPHSPAYLSAVQLPVRWEPDAVCPRYLAWAELVGISDQLAGLEEVTATMLDPSRTPPKAGFLFGPSRSGKSTWLRLTQAMAGKENTSAVTLQQLAASNDFASANVYGKILNSAADVSSAHVEDISIFKMLTGEDVIHANRKYGKQFSFTNRALFLFSANELPTVGESSRAYAERIRPFGFGRSFAGREDPKIELAMLAELPGILVRWVSALRQLRARGGYLPTPAGVQEEFETRSDRVRQFVSGCCRVHAADSPGAELPQDQITSKRVLAQTFNRWAEIQAGAKMGERKVIDRLTCIDGVFEVRAKGGSSRGQRGLNITVATDPWRG
jgi:putative DNA primase/helicase